MRLKDRAVAFCSYFYFYFVMSGSFLDVRVSLYCLGWRLSFMVRSLKVLGVNQG